MKAGAVRVCDAGRTKAGRAVGRAMLGLLADRTGSRTGIWMGAGGRGGGGADLDLVGRGTGGGFVLLGVRRFMTPCRRRPSGVSSALGAVCRSGALVESSEVVGGGEVSW